MMGYVVQNFFTALKIPLPVPPFDDLSLDTSSGFADPLTNIAFDTELTTQVHTVFVAFDCVSPMWLIAFADLVTRIYLS